MNKIQLFLFATLTIAMLTSCSKQRGLYIDGQSSTGGSQQFSGSIANSIATVNPTNGAIQAQFGTNKGFYITANWPTLGFNAYYDAEYGGWVYGHGSENEYGAFQSLDPYSGQMNYYMSSDPGVDGDPWTNLVLVLEMYPDGTVNVPGRFTMQGSPLKLVTTNLLVSDGEGGFMEQEFTIVVQGEPNEQEGP